MTGEPSGPALVVGGDSLVGSTLLAHCRGLGMAVEATSRRPGAGAVSFDLAAPDFSFLERRRYAVAYLCAAVTSMQACQADPALSRRINVDGTLALMRRLAAQGTHMVFLSSSQVFDGETPMPDESAPTAPKNVYGQHKLEVEQAIGREGLPAAVLRVPKVLADRPVGVFKAWFEALSRGETAEAATNLSLSPVMVGDVAEACRRLAAERRDGTWHLGASDEIVYADAARLMAEINGLPASLVRGAALTEAQVPGIYRHRHVAMDCSRIAAALKMPIRPSRAILESLFAGFR